MDEGSWSLLIAIIVLVILSAFFSMTETAYTSLNVIKVKSLSQKEKIYKRVLNLYDKYDKLLSTILIGNNIVNLTASSLALVFFERVLTGKVDVDITFISTMVITVAVLLFGEITPKNIAKAYPEKVAAFSYPLILFFYYIFYPLNIILGLFQKLITLIFRIKHDETITDEELLTIVEEAQEDGTLNDEESNLIKSAIEFDDLEVKDVLVPRINVVAVSIEATKQELRKLFDKERYSRIPVYQDNIDSIVGIIHEKDFYRNYQKSDFELKKYMQEAVFVVEHTKISVLLKKLQAKKVHMAVVLDEYGGTLGIVTVEDIIEELVGEIYDEYDEETKLIQELSETEFLINGATEIDDFFEKFDLWADEDEFTANTVSGFVTEVLGELPQTNKCFEFKNLSIKVTKTTRKKVLEIKVKVNEKTEDEE